MNDPLSQAEMEVAVLICADYPEKAIGAKLGKSTGTVSRQTANIYRKLGVNTRLSLYKKMVELKLI